MVAGIDLMDPVTYRKGYPAEYFLAQREHDALPWHFSDQEGRGYWIVMGSEHLDYIKRNPEVFSSAEKTMTLADPIGEALSVQRKFLVNMDPPQHPKYRRIVNRAFTSSNLERLRAVSEAVARKLVDESCERGECEVVSALASRMPLLVIGHLLGVPPDQLQSVEENARKIIYANEPRLRESDSSIKAAAGALFSHAMRLYLTLKEDPAVCPTGAFVEEEVDGEALSLEEYCFFFVQIMIAGIETSRSMIANSVKLLIEHPEQYRLLQSAPLGISNAIEEILRFEPPAYQICRTAKVDVVIEGRTILAGQKLALMQHAINRDPHLNGDPERFDIRRGKVRHRTFGVGIHSCPGAFLARVELRALLEQIAKKWMNPNFVRGYTRLDSRNINGFADMRVQFEPQIGGPPQ